MPSVLFVCTANIIRSPMAEALFRQMVRGMGHLQAWQVSSAGTWARGGGYPPDTIILDLLGKLGIDMRSHRSREVNERMLAASDIVLVMESGHKEALCVEFSNHANKIFLLSELASITQDVVDPIGGPLLDYKATLDEIKRYLQDAPSRIMALMQKKGL